MKTRALCLFAAVALTVGAAVVGCSSGGAGAPQPSSESVSTVEVALSAVGPDGATYSLAPTTTLLMSSSAITVDPLLNATTPTQSFSLPSGNYQVTLQGGTDAGAFVLNRAGDGGASTVTAYLVDKQPRAVTLTAGQATPVVFHFVIPQVGNVTFSNGTLVASEQVDAGPASASAAAVTGALVFQKFLPGMNSAVSSLFTPWDTPTEQISIAMAFSGGWTSALDNACASGTATVTVTPSVNSPTDENVAAFLSEINGAGFTLCLGDASAGGSVSLSFERTGAPQSAAFKMALGADAGSALFHFQITWVPPTPLFDGTTAYLSRLSQPLSLPATYFGYVNIGNAQQVELSNITGSTVSLQVTP